MLWEPFKDNEMIEDADSHAEYWIYIYMDLPASGVVDLFNQPISHIPFVTADRHQR